MESLLNRAACGDPAVGEKEKLVGCKLRSYSGTAIMICHGISCFELMLVHCYSRGLKETEKADKRNKS
ncbi:hypothetical protein A4A49_14292 [Nicotiana attenuata]|uniref:Uncharacterized protein n=1 Tax=Nicotiana attenuata TaxID=49451 RepID=A0A314KNW2_NICAT|nr:hypothetical protein A4A49_14292 [Nicotiana attenuata]